MCVLTIINGIVKVRIIIGIDNTNVSKKNLEEIIGRKSAILTGGEGEHL